VLLKILSDARVLVDRQRRLDSDQLRINSWARKMDRAAKYLPFLTPVLMAVGCVLLLILSLQLDALPKEIARKVGLEIKYGVCGGRETAPCIVRNWTTP
jgi:hypothetical protein